MRRFQPNSSVYEVCVRGKTSSKQKGRMNSNDGRYWYNHGNGCWNDGRWRGENVSNGTEAIEKAMYVVVDRQAGTKDGRTIASKK